MAISRKRRVLLLVVGTYLFTWALTDLLGSSAVTRQFDADHPFGIEDFSDKKIPSTRVKHLNVRHLPFGTQQLPDGPWHYISSPVAVCPFVLVSDFGYVFASMGGAGGRMWTFWFFGWQKEIYSRYYWHV